MAYGSAILEEASLTKGILLSFGVILAYPLLTTLYNLTLHPLRAIPGPLHWRASRLPFLRSILSGHLAHDVASIHASYGPIARIAPNEVSFAKPEAFQEIYGHRSGHLAFPKNPVFYKRGFGTTDGIISVVGEKDHARIRTLMNHAFTEGALRAQEGLVTGYVDQLIERLQERISGKDEGNGTDVDIVEWYNFTTFDIIGDLGFGESFHCLENSAYHPWVSLIFDTFKAAVFIATTRYFPLVEQLLFICLPKSLMKTAQDHFDFSREKVHRRLNLETVRPDIMAHIIAHNDEKNGMSLTEIEGTFNTLIVAGSETTTTVLAGVTNYLTKSPAVWTKLVEEIRGTFAKHEGMTFANLAELPYLNAVIKEGLRMCPPSPGGLPRVVPKGGDTVCGIWLPGDTNVNVPHWTISRSPGNFYQSNSFIPERWLPKASTDQSSPHFNDLRNAVQPFSVGPRSCVGKKLAYTEMRLILAKMVWAFDIKAVLGKGGESDLLNWEKQKTYVLVEKQPFRVRLTDARR